MGSKCYSRKEALTEGEETEQLTHLDQLLLLLRTLFTFYKTSYPNEINRTEPFFGEYSLMNLGGILNRFLLTKPRNF
jgi:hypothetical protein